MSISHADWASLALGAPGLGTSFRRLYPDSAHDLRLVLLRANSERQLVLQIEPRNASAVVKALRPFSDTSGLHVRLQRHTDALELQLVLNDRSLADAFNVLIADVAAQCSTSQSNLHCAQTFLSRYGEWLELLRSIAISGLSDEARRGLYCELLVLRLLLNANLPEHAVIDGWTGPLRKDQDFQLEVASIEVKSTTAREPQSILVANERQLDPAGHGSLLLIHYALDERRGGTGETLNQVCSALQSALDATTRGLFEQSLVRAGFLPHQKALYDEPRYTVRTVRYHHLHGEFPRIAEGDLREGVGSCSYRVAIGSLRPWIIDENEFLEVVRGNVNRREAN